VASKGGPFPPLASFACGDMAVGVSPLLSLCFLFLFSSEGSAVESGGVFHAGFFSSSLLLFFPSNALSLLPGTGAAGVRSFLSGHAVFDNVCVSSFTSFAACYESYVFFSSSGLSL